MVNIDDIYEMIDKREIGKSLRRESVIKLFNRLDINNTGVIRSEEFIDLLHREEKDEEWLKEFFNSIQNQEVTSKSEVIIKKLKNIMLNERLKGDAKTLDDLEW